MKRFLIAVVLLVVLTGFAVITCIKAEKLLEDSRTAVLSCTEKENNADKDRLKTDEALRVWDENRKILFMVCDHEAFAEIESKMAELRFYSMHPEFEKSSQICFELSVLFEDAKEDFYVTLENIF